MKRLIVFSALALMLTAYGVGLNTAAAARPIDMVGVWSGTARIVTDTETLISTMTLEILTQTDARFTGTMQYDDGIGAPFNVNGVVDKKAIRITGSAGIFEGAILGAKSKRIHGTGSRLETTAFSSATVIFDLAKQ